MVSRARLPSRAVAGGAVTLGVFSTRDFEGRGEEVVPKLATIGTK
jgi:hypothetical protein